MDRASTHWYQEQIILVLAASFFVMRIVFQLKQQLMKSKSLLNRTNLMHIHIRKPRPYNWLDFKKR